MAIVAVNPIEPERFRVMLISFSGHEDTAVLRVSSVPLPEDISAGFHDLGVSLPRFHVPGYVFLLHINITR